MRKRIIALTLVLIMINMCSTITVAGYTTDNKLDTSKESVVNLNYVGNEDWDTNPMTSSEMNGLKLKYYNISEDTVGIGTIQYTVSGYTPSGYTGRSSVVNIPSSIDGKKVVEIGPLAFKDSSYITNITIPKSVKTIRIYAFYCCYNLSKITFDGTGVTTIEKGAFHNLNALERLDIPYGVTTIGDDAFAYCAGLKTVTMPDTVTSIGECAFGLCNSLTDINLSENITEIKNGTFTNCASLVNIDIPYNVTKIGYNAFYGTNSLRSINIQRSANSIAYAPWQATNGAGVVNWLG